MRRSFSLGPRLCENSMRYARTRNFEACGEAESSRALTFVFPHGITTRSDRVFAQPRPVADITVEYRSLRQPGLSQPLFVSREVFRPAKRLLPDIGDPERGIDLA
jgi:hypothetical protein